jgi:hypothetical protein
VSNQKAFTRSHVPARIRSFSTARLYLMTAYRATYQSRKVRVPSPASKHVLVGDGQGRFARLGGDGNGIVDVVGSRAGLLLLGYSKLFRARRILPNETSRALPTRPGAITPARSARTTSCCTHDTADPTGGANSVSVHSLSGLSRTSVSTSACSRDRSDGSSGGAPDFCTSRTIHCTMRKRKVGRAAREDERTFRLSSREESGSPIDVYSPRSPLGTAIMRPSPSQVISERTWPVSSAFPAAASRSFTLMSFQPLIGHRAIRDDPSASRSTS